MLVGLDQVFFLTIFQRLVSSDKLDSCMVRHLQLCPPLPARRLFTLLPLPVFRSRMYQFRALNIKPLR